MLAGATPDPPEFISTADVERALGCKASAKLELVAIGDWVYRRESGMWRCLDHPSPGATPKVTNTPEKQGSPG